MYAKYHIETDLPCKVFHFGNELCTAFPDKDTYVFLCRGRHKLSFSSIDNDLDCYSIVFDVLDNDIEDFITVELAHIREKRLAEEAEAKKIAEEAEKRRISEQIKREQEEEKRRERERQAAERKRKEDEYWEQVRIEQEKQQEVRAKEIREMPINLCKALKFAQKYEETVILPSLREDEELSRKLAKELWDIIQSTKVKDKDDAHPIESCGGFISKELYTKQYLLGFGGVGRLSEGIRVVNEIGKGYGYVDIHGNKITDCIYSYAYPFSYGRAHVVKQTYKKVLVQTNKKQADFWAWVNPNNKVEPEYEEIYEIDSREDMFIDRTGKVVFSVDSHKWLYIDSFCQGVAIFTRRHPLEDKMLHVGFDVNGNRVFELTSPFVEGKWDRTYSSYYAPFPSDKKIGGFYLCHSVIRHCTIPNMYLDLSGKTHVLDEGFGIIGHYSPWSEFKKRMPSKSRFRVKKDGKEFLMDELGITYENEE